jgi:hypothetical protein
MDVLGTTVMMVTAGVVAFVGLTRRDKSAVQMAMVVGFAIWSAASAVALIVLLVTG